MLKTLLYQRRKQKSEVFTKQLEYVDKLKNELKEADLVYFISPNSCRGTSNELCTVSEHHGNKTLEIYINQDHFWFRNAKFTFNEESFKVLMQDLAQELIR